MKKIGFITIISIFILALEPGAVSYSGSVINTPNGEAYQADVKFENIKNIPLVVTRSKSRNKDSPVALLISGDGGWFVFEQKIADRLADLGISTLGLDSRKYFWGRKTPDETTKDLSKVFTYYSNEWGENRIILIGYSLGAEIVPFIVNRLPEQTRSRILSAVLLSPETTTDFEIHISNMLGMGNSRNTYNVLDEIVKMQPVPTLIVFGDGEKTRIPELLAGKAVKICFIPGDHHYKFNVQLILQKMKDNNAI